MTMHAFFTSGLFWFIEGVFATLVIIAIKLWAEDRNTTMPFWKWLVVGCWLIGLGVTIAFVGTAIGENEPHAAIMGGLIFGTIAVISGIITWKLIRIGVRPQNEAN